MPSLRIHEMYSYDRRGRYQLRQFAIPICVHFSEHISVLLGYFGFLESSWFGFLRWLLQESLFSDDLIFLRELLTLAEVGYAALLEAAATRHAESLELIEKLRNFLGLLSVHLHLPLHAHPEAIQLSLRCK